MRLLGRGQREMWALGGTMDRGEKEKMKENIARRYGSMEAHGVWVLGLRMSIVDGEM